MYIAARPKSGHAFHRRNHFKQNRLPKVAFKICHIASRLLGGVAQYLIAQYCLQLGSLCACSTACSIAAHCTSLAEVHWSGCFRLDSATVYAQQAGLKIHT